MGKSFFKNWHKPISHMKTKKQNLSSAFPISVRPYDCNGMELTFQDEETGKQITFFLSEKDKQLMLMNIDRFLNGKKVTREMYNLDKL